METKFCIRCNTEKSLDCFGKIKQWYKSYCKVCCNELSKLSYYKYIEKRKSSKKEYYNKNKDKILEKNSIYYHNNYNKIKTWKNNYEKSQKEININYKLARLLRDRLRKALKNNYKTGSAVQDLGCSVEEFKLYLESKFNLNMTWENHGEWHLDHIRPLSSFNLSIREEFLKAVHYSNLQPLWAFDNLKKSDKYDTVETI